MHSSTRSDVLRPGVRVGRYELESRIGQGGMGEVWRATAHGPGGFQKKVVIKTILPEFAHSESYVEMLINEASLSARLNHPNIVQVFELGIANGLHFIAMEYISGRTLAQLMGRAMKREIEVPTWLLLETAALCCDGLAYAHDLVDDDGAPLGLLHHDISPGNIMLSSTGRVVVLDFGIAVATRDTGARSRTLKGKYTYMAPERVQGLPADRRSDLYSLGVVLYVALTCRRPFRASSDVELLRAVVEETPLPPSAHAPWIDAELDTIVMRAMAHAPEARYQHASELGNALRTYVRRRGIAPTHTDLALWVGSLFPEELSPGPAGASAGPPPISRAKTARLARALPDIPRTPEPAADGIEGEPTGDADSHVSIVEASEVEEVEPPVRPSGRPATRPTPLPELVAAGTPSASDDDGRATAEVTVCDLFDAGEARRRESADLFGGYERTRALAAAEAAELADLFSRAPAEDPGDAWTSPRSRSAGPRTTPHRPDGANS